MRNILMVCLGNICRSPLAEGILKNKLPNSEYFIDSAGTGAWHSGEKPDVRSIEIATKYNIDISKQSARQFKLLDFEIFDLIFAMDVSNYNDLCKIAPTQQAKDRVILIRNEVNPNQNLNVPDPYYGGKNGFKKVYDILEECCCVIVNKLKNNSY